MSNVLKLNRNLSDLEFYQNAETLQGEIMRLMMNENVVPKRYRQIFSIPMMGYTIALMEHIASANAIYPKQPILFQEAALRREYQDKAIIAVHDMYQLLQCILRTLPVPAGKMEKVNSMLVREEELLIAWRKSDYARFLRQFNLPVKK